MSVIELMIKKNLEKYTNKVLIESPYRVLTGYDIEKQAVDLSEHIKDFFNKINNQIIPFYIKNDVNSVIVIYAIIKSGNIPLPMNSMISLEESIQKIKDINYSLIVSDDFGINDKQKSILIYSIDKDKPDEFYRSQLHGERRNHDIELNEISYIISTSGTTGIPKKILLTDSNILGILDDFYKIANVDFNSSILFTTPLTFDVSLTEVFAPLLRGSKLVCFEDIGWNTIKKVKETLNFFEKFKITHLSIPPSYADLLMDIGEKSDFELLKYICVAGEKFPYKLMEKMKIKVDRNNTVVFNLYGPAETTIYATYYQLNYKEVKDIPIGKPLPNVKIKLLESNPKAGLELLVGGVGISQGYSNKKQNISKFININNDMYYATGDYISLDECDNLIFLGRKDNQIKINGIRIELEEIDSILIQIENIKKSKTIYDEGKLVSFIQLDKNEDKTETSKTIQKVFPKEYNLKTQWLDEFPLNANRKVDIHILKKIFNKSYVLEDKPNNKIYNILAKILKEYKEEELSGLDSLDKVRFFTDVEEYFSINLPEKIWYRITNLKTLEIYIEKGQEKEEVLVTDDSLEKYKELEKLLVQSSLEVDFEKTSPTLYIQKNYITKKYYSILYFEIYFGELSSKEIKEKCEFILGNLVKKYDILSLILENKDDTIFKKIKSYQPIIFSNNIYFSRKLLEENFFKKTNIPLFFIHHNTEKNSVRFYFSHHIIDLYSMGKLKQEIMYMVDSEYAYNEKFSNVKPYLDYISYIKRKSSSINLENGYLPSISYNNELQYNENKNETLYSVLVTDDKNTVERITKLMCYYSSKIIFDSYNMKKFVYGSYIINIENYVGLEGSRIIGDVHSTIPFSINANDSYLKFENQFRYRIESYSKGLNFRDALFDVLDDDYRVELKDRWESMDISINYLGEVRNFNSLINNLKNLNYGKKYIIGYTIKNKLYLYAQNLKLKNMNFISDGISFEAINF